MKARVPVSQMSSLFYTYGQESVFHKGKKESFCTYIHGRLKEEKSDEDTDSSRPVAGTDVGIEGNGDDGVDQQHEIGLQDSCEPE